MEVKKRELDEMKGAFEKLQKKVHKLKEIEVDLTSQIEEESRGLDENKKKQIQWSSKLASLKLHDLRFHIWWKQENNQQILIKNNKYSHLGEQGEEITVYTDDEILSLEKEKTQSSIVIFEGFKSLPIFIQRERKKYIYNKLYQQNSRKPNLT